MPLSSPKNVIGETPSAGIRVVRFVRPDMRNALYDTEAITECSLFGELQSAALASLAAGETLIVNVGLIDRFPTAFYRLLLAVRETVQRHGARLVLCCFTPNVRECFDLMGGARLFEIRATEASALADAGTPRV